MPIGVIQDVKYRIRLFSVLVFIITGIDCLMNLTIHFLDIYFFPLDEGNNNDFKNKLTYTIVETLIFTSFITFLFISLCKKNKNRLTLISSIYLIFGLLLFCYLLLNELKFIGSGSQSSVARPLVYYQLHLDVVILSLNIISCVLRILGSIMLFIIAGNLRSIDTFLESQLINEGNKEGPFASHSRNESSGDSHHSNSLPLNKNTSNFIAINRNQSLESENKEENSMERLPMTYNSVYQTPSSGLLGLNQGRVSDSGRERIDQNYQIDQDGVYVNIKPSHNRAHSSSITSNKFSSDLYYKRIIKE